MKIVTLAVFDDEWCHGLREEPRMMPVEGGQAWRWVQTVFVVRGDTIAAHTTDYGPAENFEKVVPLFLWSPGDCDTVAQLREHADKNRRDTYWHDRAEAQKAESTLIRDAIDQIGMRAEYVRRNHRTVKELV